MIGLIFAFIMALIPPSQMIEDHQLKYISTLAILIIVIFSIPFIIHSLKKESWRRKD